MIPPRTILPLTVILGTLCQFMPGVTAAPAAKTPPANGAKP